MTLPPADPVEEVFDACMRCGAKADDELIELFNDPDDGFRELGMKQIGISCSSCSGTDDWSTTYVDSTDGPG